MLQACAHFARRIFNFRRTSWPHLIGSAVTIIILFQLLYVRHDPGNWAPSLGWGSYRLPVLKPGDFLDPYKHAELIDHSKDEIPEEMVLGITHDTRNHNFYRGGTLSLTTQPDRQQPHPSPYIYDPYPDYNSREYRATYHGHFRPCLGPRGRDLDRTVAQDMVQVYKGKQKDFPSPIFGSYEAVGLDGNVCYDRYGRLGAYGHDDESSNAVPGYNRPVAALWNELSWGKLQRMCFERNSDRYLPEEKTIPVEQKTLPLQPPLSNPLSERKLTSEKTSLRYHSRSAVIIRGWHSMEWTKNDLNYLRSLIMELSLHSGGEYEVFLLVHVLDDTIPISTVEDIQRLKQSNIPEEFWHITVFFNNEMLQNWYPKIEEHKAIFQHFQPVQIFSQIFSDFDYYWQFEMDSRNFGHMYHFLDRAINFAREQPRKYLWERNAYFYTPGVHGPWSSFFNMVDQGMQGRESVWGPVPAQGMTPNGPTPPVATPQEDAYEWGVGEDAELITFLPIFDPQNSTWGFRDIIYGFPQGTQTPRRVSVITMSRVSRHLLNLMHEDLAVNGQAMVSEMSPSTYALFNGLKAVHVPHPIYIDGQWNPKELNAIFNRGPPDKISGEQDSGWEYGIVNRLVYRISFMFSSQSSEDLYRRWLGYPPNEKQYIDGSRRQDAEGLYWFDGGYLNEDVYGRLCFPPIFVHPVKNTDEELGPFRSVHGFDD